MKQDDLLWKALLEDIFDDFLLFFFKEAAEKIDFTKGFEFLDKELDELFPSESGMPGRRRFVDKLVKVFTKEGTEEWILVHVEIQGYNDVDFAKRMFTYFYRILDKYDKPVTSIAIFTGNNRNQMPDKYEYRFMGVINTFYYNVYKIIDQDADELNGNSNPFASVVLTALLALQKGKKVEEELLQLKTGIVKALLKKAVPAKKIGSIINFLRYYVRFEKPENNSKFEEEITLITGKNKPTMGIEEYLLKTAKEEGIEEGIEKGIEKGKAIIVENLLANSDFSDEKIAAISGVTTEFVKRIREAKG